MYNYQTLHNASPRCTDLAGTLTRWPWPIFCAPVTLTYFFVDVRYLLNYKVYSHQTLQNASPQCTDLADTLTWWPWPIFWLQWLWHNLRQRSRSPQMKTSSHQTLHSASPICTDLAGILTRWPWPIFCAPVPFIHFTSTFNISSTIRHTTIKPCIVLLLNVRTLQVPWLGDLDLYFMLH